jgi:outer membrane protein assembly factor BamB
MPKPYLNSLKNYLPNSIKVLIFISLSILFIVYSPLYSPKKAQTSVVNWPMAGANPQRTSWISEGTLPSGSLVCTKLFNPYVPHKIQVIGAGDLVYVSTAEGVYALNHQTCAEQWFYATDMPVGHSPTYDNGTLYLGVYDKKIHAVDALTGAKKWEFLGNAGFDNNPVVVNGVLYTGGRDGYFYAINASNGSQIWSYYAGTPLSYSPAYDNGVLYFGDRAGRAYALQDNGNSAQLLWRTNPLSGSGFSSYWPVVYGSRVIFTGGHHYGFYRVNGGVSGKPTEFERTEAWPSGSSDNDLLGPFVNGRWIDASTAWNYLTNINKTHRQTVFILNKSTGAKMEVPPLIWQGNSSTENRAPAVVNGNDNLAYFYSGMVYDSAIPWARTVGWTPDTPSRLYYPCGSSGDSYGGNCGQAIDKPGAISSGGNYVYLETNRGKNFMTHNLSGDQQQKLSMSAPNNMSFARFEYGMEWSESDLGPNDDTHGLHAGPTPFRGKVYVLTYNQLYVYQ